jgi:hypothetical protein
VRLTIVVQVVLDLGFLWSLKLCQGNENVAQCWQYLLGLVGFDLQL